MLATTAFRKVKPMFSHKCWPLNAKQSHLPNKCVFLTVYLKTYGSIFENKHI